MATINTNFDKLAAGYLFPEIDRRMKEFQKKHSSARIMKLGIGNTTEPLTPTIARAMREAVDRLTDRETYTGYGEGQGARELREALAGRYKSYGVDVDPDEIIISDGAKSDTGNIQQIFGTANTVAVQDPAYPVYVDSNVIGGRTGGADNKGQYDGIVNMACTEENNFFAPPPDRKVDLIYLCSPNNPTGLTATHEQLRQFIDYALSNRAVIIYDAAYTAFIRDDSLPKSIYEVEGARQCAIEVSSFSKEAGFTGVRLGWSIVPMDCRCELAEPGKIHNLWVRRQTTLFNGASNIVQAGGIAALSIEGQKECQGLVDYYMANAQTIRRGLEKLGIVCYGGENAPYIWMKTPNGMGSWEFFDKLLNECHVIGTPGAGFGPAGEGYFRLSAFGHAEDIKRAVESISDKLKL